MAFELICIEVKQTIMKTSARCESKKSHKNKNIPRLQQNLSHWVYRTKFTFYIFTKIIVYNIQKSFKTQYSKINQKTSKIIKKLLKNNDFIEKTGTPQDSTLKKS